MNGFTPIEMTQFATFKFVTNQGIPKNAREKAEKCRNLLLKNGSEPFKYCEPTVNKVGNFAFCLFMAANTLEPFISFDMMNPDKTFRQVSFRVGDISQLILIKVNDFLQIEKNVQ